MDDGLRHFLHLPKPRYEHLFFTAGKRSTTIRCSAFCFDENRVITSQQKPLHIRAAGTQRWRNSSACPHPYTRFLYDVSSPTYSTGQEGSSGRRRKPRPKRNEGAAYLMFYNQPGRAVKKNMLTFFITTEIPLFLRVKVGSVGFQVGKEQR